LTSTSRAFATLARVLTLGWRLSCSTVFWLGRVDVKPGVTARYDSELRVGTKVAREEYQIVSQACCRACEDPFCTLSEGNGPDALCNGVEGILTVPIVHVVHEIIRIKAQNISVSTIKNRLYPTADLAHPVIIERRQAVRSDVPKDLSEADLGSEG